MSDDDMQLVREVLDGVHTALLKLKRDLLEARNMPTELATCGYAVTAVCNFVDTFEDFRLEGLSDPLHKVNAALFDLSQGARPPMLVPVKVENRPRHTFEQRRQRLFAVYAMEAYMQVGMPRKDAAKRTGRIFRCPHSRVAYWREQLSKREPSSDLDVWDRAHLRRFREEIMPNRISVGAWRSPQDVDVFVERLAARFRQKPPS